MTGATQFKKSECSIDVALTLFLRSFSSASVTPQNFMLIRFSIAFWPRLSYNIWRLYWNMFGTIRGSDDHSNRKILFIMSKQAKILLAVILIFLVFTVFVFRTTHIFMIGIVLLLLTNKSSRFARQLRRSYKLERMGNYFTAYKLAKKWSIPEETIVNWCQQGRIPGAFKNANLWLIPSDITMNDINNSVIGQPVREEI